MDLVHSEKVQVRAEQSVKQRSKSRLLISINWDPDLEILAEVPVRTIPEARVGEEAKETD
nr:hypothetical protein [Leptospira sp. id769339]